jgi:hypothetical protein
VRVDGVSRIAVIPGRSEATNPESIAPHECWEKWIPVSDWASLS